jgi:hypothetical protein
MPTELEVGDRDPVSAEVALPPRNLRLSAEDAWECARKLVAMLDRLSAEAAEPEHYSFRLAQALAGSLTDELEAVVGRAVRKAQEKKGRHFRRLRDCSAGTEDNSARSSVVLKRIRHEA